MCIKNFYFSNSLSNAWSVLCAFQNRATEAFHSTAPWETFLNWLRFSSMNFSCPFSLDLAARPLKATLKYSEKNLLKPHPIHSFWGISQIEINVKNSSEDIFRKHVLKWNGNTALLKNAFIHSSIYPCCILHSLSNLKLYNYCFRSSRS